MLDILDCSLDDELGLFGGQMILDRRHYLIPLDKNFGVGGEASSENFRTLELRLELGFFVAVENSTNH
jgi:hypothetical protein